MKPTCLQEKNKSYNGERMIATGSGTASTDPDSLPPILQEVAMPAITLYRGEK